MATLDGKDLEKLKAPFPQSDLKSVNKGYGDLTYIDEEAIANRIEEIDPAWQLSEPMIIAEDNNNISVKVSITIKGVTRWGVGSEKLSKDEPAKSAATDAFKRAARMFGVGRYLLSGDSGSSQPSSSNQSGLTRGGAVADGAEDYSREVIQIKTVPTKNGNMYILGDASMFEREPLGQLGYDVSTLDKVGDHFLPDAVDVKWKQKGRYKNIVAILRRSTGEKVDIAS